MNTSNPALGSPLAALRTRLTWQRVPADRMALGATPGELRLLLAYSLLYAILSGLIALGIRSDPRPLFGATYFTSDFWYAIVYKIGGLLLVSLLFMRRFRTRLSDLSPDWPVDARRAVLIAIAMLLGMLINGGYFNAILNQSNAYGVGEFIFRLEFGFALPLFTAALPEEIFFRGMLQPRLEVRAGRVVAILGTALLFTLWHLPSRYVLASGAEGAAGNLGSVLLGTGLPVFIVGLVFGLFYDRYRTLWPLIAMHWGIDAVVSAANLVGVAMAHH